VAALSFARDRNRVTIHETPCAPFHNKAATFTRYAAFGRFTAACIDKTSAALTRGPPAPDGGRDHEPRQGMGKHGFKLRPTPRPQTAVARGKDEVAAARDQGFRRGVLTLRQRLCAGYADRGQTTQGDSGRALTGTPTVRRQHRALSILQRCEANPSASKGLTNSQRT
jgi:hypothetical protein